MVDGWTCVPATPCHNVVEDVQRGSQSCVKLHISMHVVHDYQYTRFGHQVPNSTWMTRRLLARLLLAVVMVVVAACSCPPWHQRLE